MPSLRSWRWFVLSVAASAAAFGQAPAPVRFELPNGLRVWVQEDHSRPAALVQVAYKVGAINEDPGTTGTAHYVEHMVYRATEHIKNEDVYGYIDRIGGRYTGGTSRDGTTYGETVPSWALEDALRTTAERMGRALFDSVEFERERNNVVTEANGFARQDPVTAYRDALMLASFEVHPYRYSSNTWARDNLAISRSDAYDFYKHYYGPNNAVLTIVGDVRPDDVRRLVEKHFAPLARALRSGEVRVVEPPQRVEKRVVLHYTGDRQYVDLVYRAPPAALRDYSTLVVLDRLLVSRLRRALDVGVDVTTSHAATPYPFVYRVSLTAGAQADAGRLLATIESEIARLRSEDAGDAELAAARVEVVPQGRGGRGRGAGGQPTQATGLPPRQSSLTQIAGELTAREAFPWEVSAETRERIQRDQASVSAADIKAYADRWLRPSQRTIGQLLPGTEDYMPQWSNSRALAGDRLEVPPLTTPPAKRTRPTPVPARSLAPLAPLGIRMERVVLDNGVVIRAAQATGPDVAIQVRVAFGKRAPEGDDAPALVAARWIAADSGLRAVGARVTTTGLANDGYFDIRASGREPDVSPMLATIAHALASRPTAGDRFDALRTVSADVGGGRGRGGGGGGGAGAAVNATARARVLSAVAPAWRLGDPSADSLARVSAAEVTAFLDARLHGGAVTVAIVAPALPSVVLESAKRSVSALAKGERVSGTPTPVVSVSAHSDRDADQRIPMSTETQVTVLAGLPGVPRGSSDWRALELLNYIVGVPSYGGRLGWALTKVGLTYSSSATTTFGATAGHMLFSTKCDTRNLDATVQAIREVIGDVAEHGVEEWEVDEAKAFTLGRMLLYGARDDSGGDAIATALLDSELTGNELLDLPAWSRGYLSVTRDQINAAARRYYRLDRLDVVSIGAIPGGTHASPFKPGTFAALFQP
jgi:zinc protease